MRSLGSLTLPGLVLLAVAVSPPAASGQSDQTGVRKVSGSYVFRTYCASCHGEKGRGDGPLAQSLRFAPSDLTKISARNGGEYPAELVYRIIDGRKPVAGHGGPDMPVWGDAFKNVDSGFDEQAVEQKIQALVDHLKAIQTP